MQTQINQLSREVATMVATQKLNHLENRRDIGEFREGQKEQERALDSGLGKLGAALERALSPIRKDVFELQMWRSRTTGYFLGMSALGAGVGACIFEAVKYFAEKK